MRLSVIIPSYNRADLVTQTLESVLAQVRLPEEIIVMDDGSTDETRQVIEAFNSAHGNCISYHYRKNAGLAATRNAGMKVSRSDAVCMLDSDDLLRPMALARLEAALEAAPEAPVAYCRSEIIDDSGAVMGPWDTTEIGGDHTGDVWERLARINFIRSSGATLIRRSSLERAAGWDASMQVIKDWDMWLRLAEQGPFVRVDEPLFLYRVHAGTMSTNRLSDFRRTLHLYRSHLLRHRHAPEKCRALRSGDRWFRRRVSRYLMNEAFQERRRGDSRNAAVKIRFALRLCPGHLLTPDFLWNCLKTERRLAFVPRIYWALNAHVFRHVLGLLASLADRARVSRGA